MMKIYVCMAVLCINLHENEADNTTVASTAAMAKLDFWTPDPKFNDRSFENRRKMQDYEKEDKIYYRHHRHSRVNPYARFTKRAPYQNTSLKYRGRLTQGHHTKQHVDPYQNTSLKYRGRLTQGHHTKQHFDPYQNTSLKYRGRLTQGHHTKQHVDPYQNTTLKYRGRLTRDRHTKQHVDPYQDTTLKYQERLTRGRHTKQHVDHPSRKPPEFVSPHTRDKSNIVRSRAKRWRHKGRKDQIYSTRLMRQPNEGASAELETTQRSTTEEEEQSRLSPYALEKQMRRLLSPYGDVNTSIEVIGRTAEYNKILLYKLSDKHSKAHYRTGRHFRTEDDKYIEEEPEKKIVFIVHGLSVMGVHHLGALHYDHHFKELLYYYLHYLDGFDIFIIPMANPDGYITAFTKPFWNKNMSPQSSCAGVALDRNFDVAWNSEKVYSSCSQMYPGPAPFSEAETRAVRDVLHKYGHKIIAYIHVHAGTPTGDIFKGDAVLYPKGYTEVQSDDDKYIDLRGDIDETMRNASFRVMSVTVDTLHNWYGKVHGSSVDYAATVYGIPYALEFVMQIYRNVDYEALTVIWKRIIFVVFDNLWNHLHANEVK